MWALLRLEIIDQSVESVSIDFDSRVSSDGNNWRDGRYAVASDG